jgi:hypothetical protein
VASVSGRTTEIAEPVRVLYYAAARAAGFVVVEEQHGFDADAAKPLEKARVRRGAAEGGDLSDPTRNELVVVKESLNEDEFAHTRLESVRREGRSARTAKVARPQ